MIRKIPTTSLRLKMYVYDLNCDWTNHSFALREFKITSQEQIDGIVTAGIKDLYIDTDRGVDVESDDEEEECSEQIATEQSAAMEFKTKPLLEELPNAVNARTAVIKILNHIMEDVRHGKSLPMDEINGAMGDMAHSFANNGDASIGLMCIKKAAFYTVEHSVNTAILMMAFEKSLTYDSARLMDVGLGGLLMDIGKAKLPRYIIEKTDRLTNKECKIAYQHVKLGCEILSKTPGIPDIALQIAAEHHERLDGSGYPAKKRSGDTSRYGEMAAIVDVYDSLTAERAYKRGITPHAALNQLIRNREQFNHELVQQFIHCIGVYPIGSLVALSDGHFAVVVESEGSRLLSPKVRVIYDLMKRQYIEPKDIDIANQNNAKQVKIVGAVDPHKWNIKPWTFLDCSDYVI